MSKSFKDLLAQVAECPMKKVAVACAQDDAVLEAVKAAKERHIADAILVVARIIDDGIRRGDTTYVLQMGGVLLLLAACGLTFSLTAQFFAAKAAAGFGKELRHSLFDHIQKLSYTQLDNQGTSTLITRMTSDVNLVQTQVNMAIRLLLRSPFIVFGAMIMAFFVDGKTAMVFVVAIPVLSVIVYGIMLITIPLYLATSCSCLLKALITRTPSRFSLVLPITLSSLD